MLTFEEAAKRWEHAVQATIDALADELHRRLWPLGINPTVTVEVPDG